VARIFPQTGVGKQSLGITPVSNQNGTCARSAPPSSRMTLS